MTEKGVSRSFIKPRDKYGWLFISLALILLGVLLFYPIVYSLYLSTMSSKGIVQKFVGFGNYVKLFQDSMFLLALKKYINFFPYSSSDNVIFSPYTCNYFKRQNNKV